MPKLLRPALLALTVALLALGAAGCGDNSPDPSIPQEDSATLLARIQEIQDNVDVGSCIIAADRTETLIAEIQSLPSSVNTNVKNALQNGANNLRLLLADPNQCQGGTTTTSPTTTAQTTTPSTTTTTRTLPTTTSQTTTPPPTTTTAPPTTTSDSGGIGPGGAQ